MTYWLRLLLAFGALAVTSLPSPAAACSGSSGCLTLSSVHPADDATDVPRNVELRITYEGPFEAGASAVLETDDGRVVPTTWEAARTYRYAGNGTGQLWIGRIAAPLDASTHYRLRHSYRACSATDAGIYQGCDGLCLDTAGEVISGFTTGTALDEKTLAAPALGAPVMRVDSCDSSGCCGPYTRCIYTVDVPTLPSDQLLRVTKGSALVGYFASTLRVGVNHSGNGYGNGVDINGSGEYQVSVVDGSGSRSPATTLVIPACAIEGVSPDAGPDSGSPDASTPADATVTGERSDAASPDSDMSQSDGGGIDDGCALAGRASSWTSALWLALALVLARRAKRA